jgi:hypothetical protein
MKQMCISRGGFSLLEVNKDVPRSYRVGVQGGWTGAMRVVVIFLCIQQGEWDALYIRKGECPDPGWGPSCVRVQLRLVFLLITPCRSS